MAYLFWALWLAIMAGLVWHYAPLVRHSYHLGQSPRWPAISAKIVGGAIGTIDNGRRTLPAAFLSYRYSVNGAPFVGKFFLRDETDIRLKSVKKAVTGAEIDIRYQPNNPSISVLNDFRDQRLGGFTASQNPLHLRQGAPPSLEDEIKLA
jgi:hypothetical protein